MKVTILKKRENELEIEVEETGHTVCNLLQKGLLQNEDVEMAGYKVPHPLTSRAIIFIRTKGKAKPEKVLNETIKRIQSQNNEFRKTLKKALK
jgi:DNA-directed RNA polymerase subunit L